MSSSPPTKYAVALYPGFQLLDVAGPLDILNILGYHTHFDSLPPITLSILASSLDPVSTSHAPVAGRSNFKESIVPTHTFQDAPQDIEVLLIPGGRGARDDANIQPIIDFVKDRYQNLQHIITVCTGSAILALTGLLDGKEATTNKASYEWATSKGPKVDWVHRARWTVTEDRKIWTSSGVSAGMDVTYAFLAEKYGEDTAQFLADIGEYTRNTDASVDPFADRWKQ